MSPRRRKRRGEKPPALLTFDHGQLVPEPEPMDNPITRPCSHCGAGPGNPCVARGRRGGQIHGYHDSRKDPSTPHKDPCQR